MKHASRSPHSSQLFLTANEKDFSLSLEMTNAGKRHFRIESHLHVELVKRHSPSFPWKEVPRRGGGWLREAVFSHAGMPTPPRFARLPLPEEGARMILNRSLPHTYLRRNRHHTPEPRTLFLPPSFGRRCPEGAEVGRVKRYSHIRGNQPRLASLVCPFQRKGRE